MRYYLARWEWADAGGFSAWMPPLANQCIASLDFRSLPQQALPGGTPEGFGFFAYSNAVTIPGSIDLGDGLTLNINTARKTALKNSFGLLSNISATKLVDILWELLTTHADATGLLRWKPLMPNRDKTLELVLNGHSVVKSQKLIPGESPEWINVQKVLQGDYRKIRNLGLDGKHDKNLHRQFLQSIVERFKIDWEKFIPSDLPKESPLPHSTIITESFNTADSTTLGPDLSWTELEGDMDIFSNTCRYAATLDSGHSTSRANVDLASSDQYAQIVFVNALNGSTSAQGCHCRKDSSATLTYYHFQISDESVDRRRTWRRVGGIFTSIGTTTGSAAVDDVLRGEIEGSTFRLKLNGVQQHSGTDTNITGNLRCGVGMQSGNLGNTRPRIDNFEAGDLAVPIFPPFKKIDKTLIRL